MYRYTHYRLYYNLNYLVLNLLSARDDVQLSSLYLFTLFLVQYMAW